MYESKSNRSESRLSAWIVVIMLGMVAVPATITLESVRSPATILMTNSDPTPYGYTLSLLFFLVPIVVIAFWFLPREEVEIPQGFLVDDRDSGSLGVCGSIFSSPVVLSFPKSRRDAGARCAGVGRAGSHRRVCLLRNRLHGDTADLCLDGRVLAGGLQRARLSRRGKENYRRLLQFHPTSVVLGVALIALGIVYKKFFAASPAGFPGYFVFLVARRSGPRRQLFPCPGGRSSTGEPSASRFSSPSSSACFGKRRWPCPTAGGGSRKIGCWEFSSVPGPGCPSRKSASGLQSPTRQPLCSKSSNSGRHRRERPKMCFWV